MYPHRIDIFDEADGYLLILCVSNNFQLQLLPAENRFLDQDLADKAYSQSSCGDGPQFVYIVDESSAGSAHRVSGTNYDRVAKIFGDLLSLLNTERRRALGHFNA